MKKPIVCSVCGVSFRPGPFLDFIEEVGTGDGMCTDCLRKLMKTDLIPVSRKKSKTICLQGQGAKMCKYLVSVIPKSLRLEDVSFACAKGGKFQKDIESHAMVARGDNCSGPPNFSKY